MARDPDHAMVTARHVSARDVPRVDWGTLIGRSQELSRLDPDLTLSDALWRAAIEYETGSAYASPTERRLVEVARIHPERLMKPLPVEHARARRYLPRFEWVLISSFVVMSLFFSGVSILAYRDHAMEAAYSAWAAAASLILLATITALQAGRHR